MMDPKSLIDAVTVIDGLFGDGYAKEHPQLVAAVVQAAVHEQSAERMEQAVAKHGDIVSQAMNTALTDTLHGYTAALDVVLKQAVVEINRTLGAK
jgi:hypothetical protein